MFYTIYLILWINFATFSRTDVYFKAKENVEHPICSLIITLSYLSIFLIPFLSEIGPIIQEGFWEMAYPSRDFDPDVPVWRYEEGESLMEQRSDDCLAEFFGTGFVGYSSCLLFCC